MKLDTIKFPKQKSVRGGWFLSYILVLIVPLLLCLLLYNYSAGIITAESKRIYGSALDQARIDLDSYLTEIEQTLSRTMQDQTVQRIVTTKKPLDGYDQLAGQYTEHTFDYRNRASECYQCVDQPKQSGQCDFQPGLPRPAFVLSIPVQKQQLE